VTDAKARAIGVLVDQALDRFMFTDERTGSIHFDQPARVTLFKSLDAIAELLRPSPRFYDEDCCCDTSACGKHG
jgi:hypothetical protein